MEATRWDVTIIGGGLAGLTAAVHLAQGGKQVLVLEQASRLGGRAGTEEKETALFNVGPHGLSKLGEGRKILQEMGIQLAGELAALAGRLVSQGAIFDLPLSTRGLLTSKCLSWREKTELARMLLKLPKLAPQSVEHLTLQEWVEQHFRGVNAKRYFLALCRLGSYSNAPERVSAGAVLRQFQVSSGGVQYLHGGWQTMVDSIAQRARQLGVTIRTGQKVTALTGKHPALHVQLADGTSITSRYVLAALNPKVTHQLVGSSPDSSLAALCRGLTPVYGASLDVALRRLPDPKTHFALHLEEPLYYSNHSNSARLTRDHNHVVLHAFKYLPSKEASDPQRDRQELERFLDQLQPGWRNQLITSRYLPCIAVTYGMPTVERVTQTRGAEVPETVVADIPGLYLAGDWVANEALLADAAIVSGKDTAQRILAAEGVRIPQKQAMGGR